MEFHIYVCWRHILHTYTHTHTHIHTHTHAHTQLVEIKKSIRSLLQVLVLCYDISCFTPICIASQQYLFTWHLLSLYLTSLIPCPPPTLRLFLFSLYPNTSHHLLPSLSPIRVNHFFWDLREDKCEVRKNSVHMLLVCFHVCVHTACISIHLYIYLSFCVYVFKFVCMIKNSNKIFVECQKDSFWIGEEQMWHTQC